LYSRRDCRRTLHASIDGSRVDTSVFGHQLRTQLYLNKQLIMALKPSRMITTLEKNRLQTHLTGTQIGSQAIESIEKTAAPSLDNFSFSSRPNQKQAYLRLKHSDGLIKSLGEMRLPLHLHLPCLG
jgi:hypothetical protein